MTYILKPATVVFAETGPDWGADVLPGLPSVCSGVGFSLERIVSGYRLRNVSHRGGLYDVDWSGELLRGDGMVTPSCHTQDDWLSHPEYRSVGRVVFDIPSGPEWASTLLSLYRHREIADAQQQDLLAEFKGVLAYDLEEYWLMTSTRTRYAPVGADVVEHCRTRGDCYSVVAAVVGPSGVFTVGMTSEAEAWLGVTDIPEFFAATQWLTGKSGSYVWRCKHETEPVLRALVLGVDSDDGTFYVDAGGFIGNVDRPARGVVVREKSSTGSGGSLR